MSARTRILERVRASLERREPLEHPGVFLGSRAPASADPGSPPPRDTMESDRAGSAGTHRALERFEEALGAAGGECVRVGDLHEAAAWIGTAASEHTSMVVGEGVPDAVLPELARVRAQDADLAISWADAAVAETGTIILNARDGRRAQLLAPVHVVLVRLDGVRESLREALVALRPDLPSAVGLHSGPSKSADIGQVMVRGVHGPGELVALIIGASPDGRVEP